jgi:HEPN domain-containing protein
MRPPVWQRHRHCAALSQAPICRFTLLLVAAAYHCQQAAEKLIKSVLVALQISYPRGRSGHDPGLAAAQIPPDNECRQMARAFETITDWSVSFRYPADDPSQAEPLPDPGEPPI